MEMCQTYQIKTLRGVYKGLGAINILLFIVIFFFCPGDLIPVEYQCLILSLMPITYLMFVWIFKDAMYWNFTEKDKKNRKDEYVEITSIYQCIHLLLLLLFLEDALRKKITMIEGKGMFFLLLLFLSILLTGISAWRQKNIRHKKWTVCGVFIYTFVISITIMQSVILVQSEPLPWTHYPAEVISTYRSGKAPYSYSAKTMLVEGETKSIRISRSIYEEHRQGKAFVVCERIAFGGIRFVSLHSAIE